jgi:hypothetical protein
MSAAMKTKLRNMAEASALNIASIGESATAAAREAAHTGLNAAKLTNVLITGTTENVNAMLTLSKSTLDATDTNLLAVSKLTAAGIDTANLTLEQSKKYITAASDLTKSGIELTTKGVEFAKTQLEAASELTGKGIKLTSSGLSATTKLLDTSSELATAAASTASNVAQNGFKIISEFTTGATSLISGSADTIKNMVNKRLAASAAASAARQKQLDDLHTTDEIAKKKVLSTLKINTTNEFGSIIKGLNENVDQTKKTILFALNKVQLLMQNYYACKIGSFGMFVRKCESEKETDIRNYENKVRKYRLTLNRDIDLLKTKIESIKTTFSTELTNLISGLTDENKENLYSEIQIKINNHTNTISRELTTISEEYTNLITDLTKTITTDDDSTKGGKQTRRKNRRTKKTSRRHKKRTYKRVHF